ncbi:hypothetical protein [Pontibacter pamirensis]|uniref:hypothetical protein n=1 Tax=Pontibacter pamirensis TaxID=2562824 RepID=UPI00138979B5|nr:hypothetical protein [Pontibacter pamirensis]
MNVKLLHNQHVRDHQNLQRGLLVLVFFLLSAFGLQAQTVTSDKDDYAPGEVAIITGTGWAGDNFVDVHFKETPAYHAEHQHDYHGIAVDANGNWTIKYQIEDRHLGVAFDVHVVGKQTGREAFTYFTDALNTDLTVNPSTGNQGGAIILTAKLVQNQNGSGGSSGVGNGNGVPGMTVNFSLRNISVGSAVTNSNGVATLSTNVPSTIAPGTYIDGISAKYTKPNSGSYNNSDGTATLTVNSASATTYFSSLSSPTLTYGTTSTTLSGEILVQTEYLQVACQ